MSKEQAQAKERAKIKAEVRTKYLTPNYFSFAKGDRWFVTVKFAPDRISAEDALAAFKEAVNELNKEGSAVKGREVYVDSPGEKDGATFSVRVVPEKMDYSLPETAPPGASALDVIYANIIRQYNIMQEVFAEREKNIRAYEERMRKKAVDM